MPCHATSFFAVSVSRSVRPGGGRRKKGGCTVRIIKIIQYSLYRPRPTGNDPGHSPYWPQAVTSLHGQAPLLVFKCKRQDLFFKHIFVRTVPVCTTGMIPSSLSKPALSDCYSSISKRHKSENYSHARRGDLTAKVKKPTMFWCFCVFFLFTTL
jgi:hypothetical protein